MSKAIERNSQGPEFNLPPAKPRHALVETMHMESAVWDTDVALRKLVDVLPTQEQQDAVTTCAEIVEKQSKGRYQLGYQGILSYSPEGELLIKLPTKAEAGKHNRYRHQLGVAHDVAVTATRLGFPKEDVFIGALAGEIHDYEHTVFSHTGEHAFRNIYDTLKSSDPEKAYIMEKNGLHRSHERRIRDIIFDPDNPKPSHPLSRFLKSTLDTASLQKLSRTIDEEGDLGMLLKMCDTAQYLNMDSIYSGYEPPRFDKYLPEAIACTPFGLTVKNERGAGILKNMLSYRAHMWKQMYQHPFNNALSRMQTVAMGKYFFQNKDNSQMLSGLDQLLHGAFNTDEEILDVLRRNTLAGFSPEGISFFGLLYPKLVSPESYKSIQEKQVKIITNGGYKGKSLEIKSPRGDVLEIRGDPPPDYPNHSSLTHGTILEGTGDPFEDMEGLLVQLCRNDQLAYGKDAANVTGLMDYFRAKPAQKRTHPERRRVERLLGSDFRIAYKFSDMVRKG